MKTITITGRKIEDARRAKGRVLKLVFSKKRFNRRSYDKKKAYHQQNMYYQMQYPSNYLYVYPPPPPKDSSAAEQQLYWQHYYFQQMQLTKGSPMFYVHTPPPSPTFKPVDGTKS